MKRILEATYHNEEHDDEPSLKKRKPLPIINTAEYQPQTAIKWENLPPNNISTSDYAFGVYEKPILNNDCEILFKTHNDNNEDNEYLTEENLYPFMKTKISKIINDTNQNSTNTNKLQFHKGQYYTYLLNSIPENVQIKKKKTKGRGIGNKRHNLSFPVLKYNDIIWQYQNYSKWEIQLQKGNVVGTEFCSKYDYTYLQNCNVKLAVNMDVIAHIFDFLAGNIKIAVWRILKDNIHNMDFPFEMRQIICDFGDFGIIVGSEGMTPIIKSLGGIDFLFDDCHDPVIFEELWPVQNETQVLKLCLKWIHKYLVLREPC